MSGNSAPPSLPRRRRRPGRVLAIAFSGAVHILVVAGLALGLRSTLMPEPRAIEVRLVSADVLGRKPSPRRTARPQAAPGAFALHQAAASPSAPAPIPMPTPATPTAPDVSSTARAALRQALGCSSPDFYQLTDAERAKCQDHQVAIGKSAPSYRAIPTDPEEAAMLEQEGANNEAWRKYRTGAGDYPGLRCLLKGVHCNASPAVPGSSVLEQAAKDKGLE